MKSILIVDDDEMILASMRSTFSMAGYNKVDVAATGQEALEKLSSGEFSLITLDLNLPDIQGLDLLPRVKALYPELPVIVITGSNEVESAVESLKLGAGDYLVKPVDKVRLLTTVKNIIDNEEILKENQRLKNSLLSGTLKRPDCFSHIITDDPAMMSIFHYIEAISPTTLPVLITGETGTGKELLSKAVHNRSGLKGNFVAVNAAGLDDSLFSDTVFGHIKGAYTGAVSDREGMIGKAANGTLFLDEIGNLSQESQIKLLRVIQEKEYSPLGSDKILKSRARLVFAVNTPLEELVKEKKFRQDLYYRIRSHSILLPPLRKRRKDLPLLINFFLSEAAVELNRPAPPIAGEVTGLLKNYSFPGNIRELRGIIFDLILRYEGLRSISEHLREQLNLQGHDINDEDKGWLASVLSSMPRLPSLKEATTELINEALNRTSGSITEAARMLGLTRSALSKRLSRRFEQDENS